MRVYPGQVQLFRSREAAEAHAQELACATVPPWTVKSSPVHQPIPKALPPLLNRGSARHVISEFRF